MQINRKIALPVAVLAVFTALVAPAGAQESTGHEGHDMSAMMSVGEDGSWSYAERSNPRMEMHGRWEMVPRDGRASAAISAADLTRPERCAALMAAADLMHDHATLAACTGVDPSPAAEQQPPPGQDHDMDHGHNEHDH